MSNNNRGLSLPNGAIDLVDRKVVHAALAFDANEVSNTKAYRQSNEIPYYVLINTWYGLIRDLTGDPFPEFELMLRTQGLIATIRDAQDLSDRIIRGESWGVSPFGTVLRQIAFNSVDGTRLALQVLRYPKRFSPNETGDLEEQCLRAFFERNRAARDRDLNGYPQWLIRRLQRKISSYLHGFALSDTPCIATGQDFEGNETIIEKYISISRWDPYVVTNGLLTMSEKGSDSSRPQDQLVRVTSDRYNPIRATDFSAPSVNWVTTVPKSYKARRVIAKEQSYNSWMLSRVDSALRECLLRNCGIDLRDQTRNQQLAQDGSVSGAWATLDATAASDSISYGIVQAVFPNWFLRLVEPYRAKFTFDKRLWRYRPLHLYSTMGCRVTFPIESMLFLAIGEIACDILVGLGEPEEKVPYCQVYGDDLIVPTPAAELTIELLSRIGFTANLDKTFVSGPYRESCGEEYLYGYNVSNLYFPRHTLPAGPKDKVALMTVLLPLQHKLCRYRHANLVLISLIRGYYPDMTESYADGEYDDIWSDYPVIEFCDIAEESNVPTIDTPFGTQRASQRELHYTFSTQANCKCSTTDDWQSVYNFLYAQFLSDGPQYGDPLLELLRVSDQRRAALVHGETTPTLKKKRWRVVPLSLFGK